MCPDDLIPEIPAANEPASSAAQPAEQSEALRLMTTAERTIEGPAIESSLSAIAMAKTGSLKATASAIGMATVEGDTDIRLSSTPLVYTKGNASFHQSYASAFIAGSEIAVSQGGAPAVVARTITFEQGGAGVAVAGSASVRRGFVGLLLANNSEISEDSRVLMTGRSVGILAAAILGGFVFVAIAMAYSASQVSHWRPNISLPDWPRRR